MGRTVAWVGFTAGGLVIFASLVKDLVRLLQYRSTFPGSSDWKVGLTALAVVVALGSLALCGAWREWRGERANGWTIAPAVAVLLKLADPLFLYPPAAFSPQMMFYLSIYPFGWPRVLVCSLLAWGAIALARKVDGEPVPAIRRPRYEP